MRVVCREISLKPILPERKMYQYFIGYDDSKCVRKRS